MKITNEQLKQIIKEELDAVLEESALQALGIAGSAARARRQATNSSPTYIPTSRSSSQRQRDVDFRSNMKKIRKDLDARAAASAEESEAQEQYAKDVQPTLDALGQAKLRAIQALGTDEDGNLPYVYTYSMDGSPENLSTYYDGPLYFQDAIRLAKDVGELSHSAIDQESGGFNLEDLFPGRYI